MEDSKWETEPVFKSGSCLIALSCWSGCFWAPTLNVLFSRPQSRNPLIRVEFRAVKSQATVFCETVCGRASMAVCVFSAGNKTPRSSWGRREDRGGHEMMYCEFKWKETKTTRNKRFQTERRSSVFPGDLPLCISLHLKPYYLEERESNKSSRLAPPRSTMDGSVKSMKRWSGVKDSVVWLFISTLEVEPQSYDMLYEIGGQIWSNYPSDLSWKCMQQEILKREMCIGNIH